MALLHHLLCGLVLFCLIMDVKTHTNTDDFRCPAEMADEYCTLNQVKQPHNIDPNAQNSYPLTILKHCQRRDKESIPAGGIWFTRENCKMLKGYVNQKKKDNKNYWNLFSHLECRFDGWQTGDNCRLKQNKGRNGKHNDDDYIETALHKGSETGFNLETVSQLVPASVKDTVSQLVPATVKQSYQKYVSKPPDLDVDKTNAVIATIYNAQVLNRGFHYCEYDQFIVFVMALVVFAFVCMLMQNDLHKDGWILNVQGVPFVACVSSNIIWIDNAQTDNVSPHDQLLIERALKKPIPKIQDSSGKHSHKVYRNATASQKLILCRCGFIGANYIGVGLSNAMVLWWFVKWLLDIFDASAGTGTAPPVQAPVQTTTIKTTTWEDFVGLLYCIPNLLLCVARFLSNMRNTKTEMWQKLQPKLSSYLLDVVYMGIAGLGFFDPGFFEWRIFLVGIVLCSPLLHFLDYHVWIFGQVQEGVSEQFIANMYNVMTKLTDSNKTFVFLFFAIHVWSLSTVWKDMVSAGRSGSVSLITHCVLMLNVSMMIISVYFAPMETVEESGVFGHWIWSQFGNLAVTPIPEALIAMSGDMPDCVIWFWGYPYRVVQAMSLEPRTAFFIVFVFLALISVNTNRDQGELIWKQLRKCGENMWEFAFKGVFVPAKLPLLYICICWTMLCICTCRVENTGTKDLMSFVDYYRDWTSQSNIQVPRVVHTWMHKMLFFSVVHVLFTNWWGTWGKQWTENNRWFSYLHGKTTNSTHHSSGNHSKIKPTTGCTINQIYMVSITPTVYVKDFLLAPIILFTLNTVVVSAMTTETLFVGLLLFLWGSWQTFDIKTEFKNVPSPNAVGDYVPLECLLLPAANMGTEGHWCLAKTIFIETQTGKETFTPKVSKNVYYLFRREDAVHVLCDGKDVMAIRVEQKGCTVRTYEYQPAGASDNCE